MIKNGVTNDEKEAPEASLKQANDALAAPKTGDDPLSKLADTVAERRRKEPKETVRKSC